MPPLRFEHAEFAEQLMRLLIAYALAMPIGWHQEQETRVAGVRTFPLVALGACAFMLIGLDMEDVRARAQIAYGIITGIGFIGGLAYFRHGRDVRGAATAASLWNTGAIGMAVAWGRLDMAVTLSLINFMTLFFAYRLRARLIRQAAAKEKEPPE